MSVEVPPGNRALRIAERAHVIPATTLQRQLIPAAAVDKATKRTVFKVGRPNGSVHEVYIVNLVKIR